MNDAVVILLAAGASTRMGVPKPLLKIKNKTWLEYQLESLNKLKMKTCLVLGFHAELIQSQIQLNDVTVCLNKNPEHGQFSSIQCGLKAINAKRYFIQPIDVPVADIKTWQSLTVAPACDVVQPEFQGRAGHPILISKSFRDVILTKNKADRLDVMIREASEKLRVQTEDPNILLNLNTPEEFQKYIATL